MSLHNLELQQKWPGQWHAYVIQNIFPNSQEQGKCRKELQLNWLDFPNLLLKFMWDIQAKIAPLTTGEIKHKICFLPSKNSWENVQGQGIVLLQIQK